MNNKLKQKFLFEMMRMRSRIKNSKEYSKEEMRCPIHLSSWARSNTSGYIFKFEKKR